MNGCGPQQPATKPHSLRSRATKQVPIALHIETLQGRAKHSKRAWQAAHSKHLQTTHPRLVEPRQAQSQDLVLPVSSTACFDI